MIYHELKRAFTEDDIPTLVQMFASEDDQSEIFRQRLSQESKTTLRSMQPVLKLRIKASIRASKGSIFYVQKASQGLQNSKLSLR